MNLFLKKWLSNSQIESLESIPILRNFLLETEKLQQLLSEEEWAIRKDL